MEVHYGDARNTDVDFSALDGDGTVDEVIAALRASGAVAIAAGGSGVSPLNDYAPAHVNHCHLDVFPFGLDGSIPLGMSFEFWASALVRRAPRVQFGGNATFLAHLFDVYMKHAGNSSVNVAVKISPGVLRGADSLDEKVIREVALVLCAKNNDRTRRDLLEKVGQPAFDLARSLRRVAVPIELTDPFYNRWLSRTVAAEHMAIIISRARTVLRVFVLRNAATAGWRGNDTLPTVLRGHSIAFPNPDLGELRRRIPYAPEELCEFSQVLLLDAVTDRADLERKIRSAKCLQIRGAVVAAWLEHAEHTQPGIHVDAALVQAYRRMGMVPTVPDALIAHAVAAHDARMAATLNAAFESDRTGNAAVRQQQAGFEAAAQDAPQAAAANVASGADAHTAGLPEMCLRGEVRLS
ncbi:hypothetical protein TSOC_014399 [Tetrabaena socialis]|uniref:DUF6570 domain-containing protein n=1 Tax=Tetrabaena socialis TaxID=47790 RepID=A0A2J7ZHR9_9CHLO|nr:hypothetical protein TSOC_014399 [Tetrabaena socialis]|eukprot:PNG99811.1 hypothetical protein TSOC_014399 [Tetrabaena socialis]